MKKKTINLTVSPSLVDRFDDVCGRYGHGKQKGMVLSAAILMFLEATAARQAEYVKRVAVSEVEGRLCAPSAGGKPEARPRLAARSVRSTSRRGRRGLPPLPG
jgi:hypothetical protein